MSEVIYLDWAATSYRRPQAVLDAVAKGLTELASPARGSYGPGLDASRELFMARLAVADFFGTPQPELVMFAPNVTFALNTVLLGMFEPGDHVISSEQEHNAVLRPLHQLSKMGVDVDYLPLDEQGNVRVDLLPEYLKDKTKAIVLAHGGNVTGNLLPALAIREMLDELGSAARLILDVAQTAGDLPVTLEATGADILCFTGHKGLMAPPGTGGIVLREALDIRPLYSGGSGTLSFLPEMPEIYPTRLEAGTANVPGAMGLRAAVRHLKNRGEEEKTRAERLARRFYEAVRQLPGICFYGDYAAYDTDAAGARCPIVSLNLQGKTASEVADRLWREAGICVRAGSHCAPRLHRHFGTADRGIVRFSFNGDNTQAEIEGAVVALERING